MIEFPSRNKKFNQTNRSDILGNLAWTFNIDPQTRLGRLRISPRTLALTTTSGNSDLTNVPVGFRYFNGKLWTVAGSKVHVGITSGVLNQTFSADATSGSPTTCSSDVSDIEVVNDLMYVSTNSTTLYKYNGSWNTISIGSAGASVPHMMTSYAGLLYYVENFNKIYSVTSADATNLLLTLNNTVQITVMRSAANKVWIGTMSRSTSSQSYSKGYVYSWDGASNQATASYRLEAQGCLAMVIKDDIPWIVDSNGCLMFWNGGTFTEAARFPLSNKYLTSPLNSTNNRWIHPNGMTIVNGKINILINNQLNDNNTPHSILENCPSGIWEFDPDIGLYHKESVSYTPRSTTTITDYAQNRISRVGAISDMKIDDNGSSANGQLIFGASYYTDGSSITTGIFIDDFNDTVQKYGYFVTTKIDAPAITDTWQKIFMQYRRLLNSTDKIVVKYRTVETDPTEMAITWSSTNQFTTSDSNAANYVVGDEIEVVQGPGSGLCSHITAISVNAGTYTVTVDETYTGVVNTNTARARMQKWTKIATTINDQNSDFKELPLGPSTTWIQFKICMLFTGKNQFEEFYLVSTPQVKAQ